MKVFFRPDVNSMYLPKWDFCLTAEFAHPPPDKQGMLNSMSCLKTVSRTLYVQKPGNNCQRFVCCMWQIKISLSSKEFPRLQTRMASITYTHDLHIVLFVIFFLSWTYMRYLPLEQPTISQLYSIILFLQIW